MALRMIEIVLPEDIGQDVHTYMKEHPVLGLWTQQLAGEQILVKVPVDAEEAETVLDLFERNYGSVESFRAVLLPVEASLPRVETGEQEATEEEGVPTTEPAPPFSSGLYSSLSSCS